MLIQQATLINPTLAQNRSCNGIKHPDFQHGENEKATLVVTHSQRSDVRSRPTKGKRRVPVKGDFYLVPGLENRVTNYRLLPADTVEGQAYVQARRGAFWSIIHDARRTEKEIEKESRE